MSLIAVAVEKVTGLMEGLLFANVLFFIPGINLPFIIFWVIVACIFFCIKLDFVNFTKFTESFKIFAQKEKLDSTGKSITSRSAFLGAISGCVGVGSVSGVAASVYYGGPGVVFWLLIAAIFAMPLRFAEVFLGHHFRKKDNNGNIVSYGPFAYIKYGLSGMGLKKTAKIMVIFFAICLILTSLSAIMGQVGPTTEIISHSFFSGSQVAAGIIGACLACFTLMVIFGGLSRISKVIESLAVSMSLIYIASIVIILVLHAKNIPSAAMLIMDSAFKMESIYGGTLGTLIVAFTRIVAMNEVGMGTVAILHGKSKTEDSAREGLLAMSGPFVAILTFVALNSFAVIVTNSHISGENGVMMINAMFKSVSPFLSFALIVVILLFAITTLIAWYFYVETAIKEISQNKFVTKLLPLAFFLLVVSSSFIPFSTILKFTDVIGISVIIPNIIVLYILSSIVKKGLKKYKSKF